MAQITTKQAEATTRNDATTNLENRQLSIIAPLEELLVKTQGGDQLTFPSREFIEAALNDFSRTVGYDGALTSDNVGDALDELSALVNNNPAFNASLFFITDEATLTSALSNVSTPEKVLMLLTDQINITTDLKVFTVVGNCSIYGSKKLEIIKDPGVASTAISFLSSAAYSLNWYITELEFTDYTDLQLNFVNQFVRRISADQITNLSLLNGSLFTYESDVGGSIDAAFTKAFWDNTSIPSVFATADTILKAGPAGDTAIDSSIKDGDVSWTEHAKDQFFNGDGVVAADDKAVSDLNPVDILANKDLSLRTRKSIGPDLAAFLDLLASGAVELKVLIGTNNEKTLRMNVAEGVYIQDNTGAAIPSVFQLFNGQFFLGGGDVSIQSIGSNTASIAGSLVKIQSTDIEIGDNTGLTAQLNLKNDDIEIIPGDGGYIQSPHSSTESPGKLNGLAIFPAVAIDAITVPVGEYKAVTDITTVNSKTYPVEVTVPFDVTITNTGLNVVTDIYLDKDQNPLQDAYLPPATGDRTLKYSGYTKIGTVLGDGAGGLLDIGAQAASGYGVGNAVTDLSEGLGLMRESNLSVSSGTGLGISVVSGLLKKKDINIEFNTLDPHNLPIPSTANTSFFYANPSGFEFPGVNLIDPLSYWDGASVVAIPGSSSRAAIHRVFITAGGLIIVSRPEAFYNNTDEAITALVSGEDPFNPIDLLKDRNNVFYTMAIVIEKGHTQTSDATFKRTDFLGLLASGGATSLDPTQFLDKITVAAQTVAGAITWDAAQTYSAAQDVNSTLNVSGLLTSELRSWIDVAGDGGGDVPAFKIGGADSTSLLDGVLIVRRNGKTFIADQTIIVGAVTGGGNFQVSGDVNISGQYLVNNVPIGGGGVTPGAWQLPTPPTPGAPSDLEVAPGFQALRYRLDGIDGVQFEGGWRSTAASFILGGGTRTLFTLPVGYRPLSAHNFQISCVYTSTAVTALNDVWVRVNTNGVVELRNNDTLMDTNYVFMLNFRFSLN